MSRAQPIINSTKPLSGMVTVAHSCPTFGMVPPRPPTRRPLKPKMEPPSLLLPSSPMFETELSRQSSGENAEKVELSRSLTNYSGFSCPDIPSGFLMGISRGQAITKNGDKFSSGSISTSHTGTAETKLSSSPTVFELLKRRAINNSGEINIPSARHSSNLPPPQFSSHTDDDLALQFDLTLGDGDAKNSDSLHPNLT